MKTILILSGLLFASFSAQAQTQTVRVQYAQVLNENHPALNSLAQNDIVIDTAKKKVRVKLSNACNESACPHTLQYDLDIQKLAKVIEAEGEIQVGPRSAPERVKVLLESTDNHSTLVKIKTVNGTSTFVAGPIR